MFNIFLSGIIAVFIVTLSNIIIMKSNIINMYDILKISIYILPLQFLIGVLFTYYYNKGVVLGLSYPLLIIISYGLGIVLALLTQYFLLNKNIKLLDYISIFFILLGISIYIINKFYNKS